MNLRPPGYEPGELPDCSTPRRGPDCSTLGRVIRMSDWVIWGALILVSGAGIAAFALLVVRALEAWRRVRDSRREVVRRLDEIAAKAETTAEKVAAAGDTAELQKSLGRLRLSLARLAVLRDSLDEARVSFARIVPLP